MKIPLFDVDGTIIPAGTNALHHQAFEHAFRTVYKVEASVDFISHAGKIDRQILREVLLKKGLQLEQINDSLDKATKAQEEYFIQNIDRSDIKLLPGVKELLIILREKNCPVGLLTGNIEPVGWGKMEKLGIRDLFDFGAFGNLADRRVDLIDIAVKRAEDIFGKKFKKEDFVIIGDTPRDIECAKQGGISCIAVSTGDFSREELVKEGPDLVLDSLVDQEPILEFLGVDNY